MSLNHILLTVTGLSPQVVTETLYALYREGGAMPTEVHLLSTTEGAERARLTLITEQWFARLCQDYLLPPIRFNESHIHILEQANGDLMGDIRTLHDNQAAADNISEWIRRFTQDPNSCLHVSIAGGRKTMGFYAGYALSLYGRRQDRLSHVLVSAPYESHPQFYYPTPTSHIIYTLGQSGKPLDTRDAEVTLADIPFVRLRHGLPDAILSGKTGFIAAVNKAQETLGPAHLHIDLGQQRVNLAGLTLSMPPAELAFYSWFARRKATGLPDIHCPAEGCPESDHAQGFLAEYRQMHLSLGAAERTEKTLANGMEKAFFMEKRSKVNRLLKQQLGHHAEEYSVHGSGKRGYTRYGVRVKTGSISFS